MALQAEDLATLRQWIGSSPDDEAVNVIFDLHEGYDATVMHILRQRLADLTTEPGSLTVPGLSISHSSDLQALRDLIALFKAQGGTGLDEVAMFRVGSASIRRDFPR